MNCRVIFSFTLVLFFLIPCESIVDDDDDSKSDDIDITRAPFTLSLKFNGSHICGATIISEDWGITAAHCVNDDIDIVEDYTVRSGSTYREQGGTIHKLTKIIRHEKYDILNSDYDIAVFTITPSFNFSSTTKSIALPINSTDNSQGIAVGWGAFSNSESDLSDRLKSVVLPQMEKNKCVGDYNGYFDVTPRQLCYGYQKGGMDTCKGDSGGPLFTFDYILIGITSWGDGCAEAYSPGVYTNMKMMTEWIKNQTDI